MAIKKSQLYSALWDGCDELRGGMDASQYKDYVLVVLFVKYISDKAKKDSDMLISVPEGCSFDDMVALKGKTNIGEEMNKILEKLAEANGLTGVITNADFSDENKLGKGKDLVETVSKLIAVFQREELDFSNNRAADDDLIGDAYEYLMKNFASESGKSKGQFYTPAEVSRIMAKVIGIGKDERQMISIYDPTCGSGSLLLRAKAEAKHNVSIDGQEKDLATIGMARMSMIIHGVDDAELRHGDTLNDPLHKENDTTLQTFDYVVANPPFSMKGWRKSAKEQDIFGRWGFGEGFAPVPPPGCGDYAFLLHIIKSLKTQGHAACILPHGVLFRGGAEAEIRKFLVRKHWISGIIGLPGNLFYGTGIPACIIIIDKEHAAASKGIFMIDAKEGFQKDGAKNRLREQDIKLIVDTWEAHEDVPHYAKFVPFDEIAANDYNLNIPRYVVPEDKEIRQDIYAHLHGGLPAHDVDEVMASIWDACPTLKDNLFKKEANGYYSLIPAADKITDTINADASYKKQNELYAGVVDKWCKAVSEDMSATVKEECEPKMLIAHWSEKLLDEAKKELKLVAPYNVYEILMNYWAETMQDDCYMVSRDGWKANLNLSSKKKYTFEDCSCDLLPIPLVIAEYFKDDYNALKESESSIEQLNADIDSLVEDHPDDFGDWFSNAKSVRDRVAAANVKPAMDGESESLEHYLELLAEGTKESKKKAKDYAAGNTFFSQFEKVGKSTVAKRLKEIGNYDPLLPDTLEVLESYVAFDEKLAAAKVIQKELSAKITAAVIEKYADLSSDIIKSLVIEKKWIADICHRSSSAIYSVLDSITRNIKELNSRYIFTLPFLEQKNKALSDSIQAHLNSFGINDSSIDELLNGRKRIPGFTGEWVEKTIGELGELTGAGVDKLSIETEKPVRLVNYVDVFHKDFLYNRELNFWVTASDKKIEKCNVMKGDVFFTPSSEMPYDIALSAVAMEDMPGVCYSYHVYRLRFKEDIDLSYKAYLFKTAAFYKQASTLCEGSGKRYVISMPKFRSMVVKYPQDIEEQKAIAKILSDIDLRISTLDDICKKNNLIKQGMIQELLTGKTRL